MNVQAEKLKLIEWLIGLQDIATLEKLEKLRNQSEIEAYEVSLKPMTLAELEARALESSLAIEKGEVRDIQEILQN